MMSPSRTPHSGGNVWKRLLITAFILSWRIQSTTTQSDSVSVVPNPPNGTVGSSITLDIWGFSGEAFSYNWYRKTTESSNRFITYHIPSGVQTPADKRETVFPNGSLLIPNLTLNDTDLYIVQIIDSRGVITVIARGQLTVNAEKSTENGNGSSFSEGAILLLKTGVLAGVALMGGLIYFMFFRKTERSQ